MGTGGHEKVRRNPEEDGSRGGPGEVGTEAGAPGKAAKGGGGGRLEARLDAMTGRRDALKTELRDAEKRVKELTRRAEKAEAKAEGLQSQLNALREQLETLEAEVETLEVQCDELERTGGERAQKQVARLEKEKEALEGYLDQLARYAFALRDLTDRILKHDRAYGSGTAKLIKRHKWWRRFAIVTLFMLAVLSYGRFAGVSRVVDNAIERGKAFVADTYKQIRHRGD